MPPVFAEILSCMALTADTLMAGSFSAISWSFQSRSAASAAAIIFGAAAAIAACRSRQRRQLQVTPLALASFSLPVERRLPLIRRDASHISPAFQLPLLMLLLLPCRQLSPYSDTPAIDTTPELAASQHYQAADRRRRAATTIGRQERPYATRCHAEPLGCRDSRLMRLRQP